MPNDPNPDRVAAALRLVRHETACLNRQDLDAWIALFTDDGYYWMPLEAEQTGPEEHDSLIYDNRVLMEIRKHNLGSPNSPSMQTPVRSVRVLSDPVVTGAVDDPEALDVEAYVVASMYHRRQSHYAGRVTYRLIADGEDLRIRFKRVDLINADAPLDPIMMYV